jgi:hypothetical protein
MPKDEYDIVVNLRAVESVDRDELEDRAFEVLDAVEQHAGGIADGAGVAANFPRHEIELVFTVFAAKPSEVHQRVADVMAIVEQHTPITMAGSATAAPHHDEETDRASRALVC